MSNQNGDTTLAPTRCPVLILLQNNTRGVEKIEIALRPLDIYNTPTL